MSNSTVKITSEALKSATFDYVGAVASIAERNAERDVAGGMLMWDAALVMGAALDNGLIGKAKKDGSTSPIWSSQSDYATAAGYDGSGMGTLLPRLAKAQSLGIAREDAEWTFLTKHGQSARVGAVVKEATSKTALKKGLGPLQTEVKKTGKVAAKKGETRGAAKKTASEKEPEVVTLTPALPSDVAVVLHSLRVPVHTFTAEQWTEARGYFEAFMADEDKRRETIRLAAEKKASRQAKVAEKIPA